MDSGLPMNFGALEFRCRLTTHHTYFIYINVHEVYCGRGGFSRLIWCVDDTFWSSHEFWKLSESRCELTTHTDFIYINVHEVYCGRDDFPRLI